MDTVSHEKQLWMQSLQQKQYRVVTHAFKSLELSFWLGKLGSPNQLEFHRSVLFYNCPFWVHWPWSDILLARQNQSKLPLWRVLDGVKSVLVMYDHSPMGILNIEKKVRFFGKSSENEVVHVAAHCYPCLGLYFALILEHANLWPWTQMNKSKVKLRGNWTQAVHLRWTTPQVLCPNYSDFRTKIFL